MTRKEAIELAKIWGILKPSSVDWTILVTNVKKNIKDDYRRLRKF